MTGLLAMLAAASSILRREMLCQPDRDRKCAAGQVAGRMLSMSAERRARNMGEAGAGPERWIGYERAGNEGRSEKRKVGLQCVAHDSLSVSGAR